MTPQCHAIFCIMPPLLVVLAVKVLVTLCGVSSHLIWPFKVWLILKFFQDFVHWFSEHNTDYLSISSSRVPSKISLRSVVIVPIRPEIPFILKDHFSFPFSLLLVLFKPLILVNTVYELTHTPNWFPGQRLSQIMLSRQTDLKSSYSHIIKVLIYLVKHLPISF